MRIISGKYGGRRLNPPSNLKLRPTTDMAKEGLFNILNNIIDFQDVKALDLFAGIGSISLELCSRDVKSVVSVDKNFKNLSFIKSAVELLQIDNLTTVKSDVFKYLNNTTEKFDLVFADPPYDFEHIVEIYDNVFQKNILKDNGLFILEHPSNYKFEGYRYFIDHRVYSRVNFSLFKYSEKLSLS